MRIHHHRGKPKAVVVYSTWWRNKWVRRSLILRGRARPGCAWLPLRMLMLEAEEGNVCIRIHRVYVLPRQTREERVAMQTKE